MARNQAARLEPEEIAQPGDDGGAPRGGLRGAQRASLGDLYQQADLLDEVLGQGRQDACPQKDRREGALLLGLPVHL